MDDDALQRRVVPPRPNLTQLVETLLERSVLIQSVSMISLEIATERLLQTPGHVLDTGDGQRPYELVCVDLNRTHVWEARRELVAHRAELAVAVAGNGHKLEADVTDDVR